MGIMLSISLGPLALPLAPLALLAAVWLAGWLATRGARAAGLPAQETARADTLIWRSAGLGLLAARLGQIVLDADLYRAAPLSVLDLRDGGWHLPSGIVAGLLALGVLLRRAPPALHRPVGVAALVALVLWGGATATLQAGRPTGLPALAVTPLDDTRPVDLSTLARGRPTVVNLWASWCGPCRQEMPLLAATQAATPGVRFLFVNQGESAGAIRAYLTDQDLTLHDVLRDPDARLGPAIGSRGLPTTLFLDARGRLVDAHFGVLSAVALQSRLRRITAPVP
jgi:thiol-disulfide isomerase/thioredoxin